MDISRGLGVGRGGVAGRAPLSRMRKTTIVVAVSCPGRPLCAMAWSPRARCGRRRALRSLAACSLLHALKILQGAAMPALAARFLPCLRLRGGGYAYQKPGRRPHVERHTPGQVDSRDVPHMTEYTIDPAFDVDKQRWYTGTVENPKEFWGRAGPPPLPDDVPEVVKLALGDRINRPINVEIAMSWVLATDTRLKERLRFPMLCVGATSCAQLFDIAHLSSSPTLAPVCCRKNPQPVARGQGAPSNMPNVPRARPVQGVRSSSGHGCHLPHLRHGVHAVEVLRRSCFVSS